MSEHAPKNRKHGTAIAGIVLNAIAIIIMMIIFAAALSISSDDKTNTVAHKMETETSNADESSTEKDTHIATVGEYIEGETWKISLLDAKE